MENNKSKKSLGVVLGVVVILGVIFSTIFLGKKSNDTTVSAQSSSTPTNTSSNTDTSTIVNTKPAVSDNTAPTNNTSNSSTTSTPAVADTKKTVTSTYKDGSYTATGSYMSPGGEDQLLVSLTLANDVVTDVSVTPQAGDRTSSRYQARFISGYKSYVVGQNIASIYLTKVSGSSLTPVGFNDALNQIKSQAKA